MILSTKGRYAVMALVELARHGGDAPVSLSTLAEAQEIPLAYLEQIFARLRKAELVKSVRGPGGGYKLAREAEAISVAEVMLAADEAIKMTRCEPGKAGCMAPNSRCLTHDLWEGLGQQIHGYLTGVSLEDVVQKRVKAESGAPAVPYAFAEQA